MQVHASHPKEKPEVMIILWTCCDCKMAMAIPWRVRDKLRFVGRILEVAVRKMSRFGGEPLFAGRRTYPQSSITLTYL
jgi:hypothetical protein